MYAEIGSFSLYLCLLIHGCSCLSFYLYENRLQLLRITAVSGFLAAFIAFISLVICFGVSDFSVLNVVNNSHTAKPMIFKLAGAWSNHEGSMLLWIAALSFFSLLFAYFARGEQSVIILTLFIQNLLISFFTAFTIFTSSPFKRIFPVPLNGLGLNPILQDIGLAMHPPLLYLGYVGFSICYSAAIASLWLGRVGNLYASIVRPWVLLSFGFLTMGIALGSWWAYRELGWGGFWFWDPVENSSLMPWLTAAALLHALIILQKFGRMQHWSILLSIATFTFSMIGTFLVRSNLITSVHAFASDPQRGIMLLAFLGGCTSLALLLYAVRGPALKDNHAVAPLLLSREPFIFLNNLLLSIAAFIVFFGTLYPSLLEMLTGHQVSVAAPYFNSMMTPLSAALMLLMVVGSQLNWKGIKLKLLVKHNTLSFIFSWVITILLYYRHEFRLMLTVMSFLSLWGLLFFIMRIKHYIIHQPAMWFAHVGGALLVFAISIYASFASENEQQLKVYQRMKIANFELVFKNIELQKGKNFIARVADFEIYQYGAYKATLSPQTRFFPIEGQQTTEAAIYHGLFYDLYLATRELDESGLLTVHAYYKPMMSFIWLACLLMIIAVTISFYYAVQCKKRS